MSELQGGFVGKDGVISDLIGHDFDGYSEINENGTLGTASGLDSVAFSNAVTKATGKIDAGAEADKSKVTDALIAGNYYLKQPDGGYAKITKANIDQVRFDTPSTGTGTSTLPATNLGNVYLAKGTRTGIVGLEASIKEIVSATKVASASDALSLQLEFIKFSSQITAASQITKTVGDSMNSTARNVG